MKLGRTQWRRCLGLFGWAALTAGAASCAAIVGADDYKVGPTGGGTDGGTDGATRPNGVGETLCDAATPCAAGLVCVTPKFAGSKGLCTSPCSADSACDADHSCISGKNASDNFPGSCLKKCATGTCPAGMFCGEVDIGKICVPTDWLGGGIGDACSAHAQCKSGMCRNLPNGWCSEPCGAANSVCAHDAEEFQNVHGEFNWCVSNLGATTCVSGCDIVATVCSNFPGTTCKDITDVGGTAAKACMPP